MLEGSGPKHRRAARRALAVPVELFDGVATHRAVARNLSTLGVFLAMDPPLPLGAGVSFRLGLPGDDHRDKIGLRGHVRWTRSLPGPGGEPVGVGVELYEPDAAALARIAAWVG